LYKGTVAQQTFAKNVTRCFRRLRIPPTSLDTAPCAIEGGQAQVQAHPHVASHSAIFVNGLPRREARQCAPHMQTHTRPPKCSNGPQHARKNLTCFRCGKMQEEEWSLHALLDSPIQDPLNIEHLGLIFPRLLRCFPSFCVCLPGLSLLPRLVLFAALAFLCMLLDII
jgi:hypothetical protein